MPRNPALTEADVEAAAFGPDIAPDTPGAGCADYWQVMLERRLRDALHPKLISGEVGVRDAGQATG